MSEFGQPVDPTGHDSVTGAPNTCEVCGAPLNIELALTDNEDGTVGVALECQSCGALYDPTNALSALELLDELGG